MAFHMCQLRTHVATCPYPQPRTSAVESTLGVTKAMHSPQDADSFRQKLSNRTPHATQHLRALIERQLPPDVTGAEVQLFFQDDGGAPSAWIYFDGRNKKVSKTDLSIFPGRSMELDLGLEVLSDLESHDTSVAADVVKYWLAECWHHAGGKDFGVPVVLTVHDGWGDGKQLNLRSQRDA
jgi:hypothetical protein